MSSLCSVKEANGMYGLLTSHTATTLSRNREQLWERGKEGERERGKEGEREREGGWAEGEGEEGRGTEVGRPVQV